MVTVHLYFWGWHYLDFEYPDGLMESIHVLAVDVKIDFKLINFLNHKSAIAPLLNGTLEVKVISIHSADRQPRRQNTPARHSDVVINHEGVVMPNCHGLSVDRLRSFVWCTFSRAS